MIEMEMQNKRFISKHLVVNVLHLLNFEFNKFIRLWWLKSEYLCECDIPDWSRYKDH